MQEVILVNGQDEQTGVMEKMEAHQKGLLHRAFSIFIFNNRGEMLLQQRASSKYHSPDLWTNACCSHPQPGETTELAAFRRLREELGFETKLFEIFSFTYRAVFENGLTEHEFDHVLIGTYNGQVFPNAEEVKDYCFMKPEKIKESLSSHPHKYTEWFKIAFPKLEEYLAVEDINT
ncbi:MAG: isopentenyl-diphosphate Delta-isomerase [Ferruginibacter sp.]